MSRSEKPAVRAVGTVAALAAAALLCAAAPSPARAAVLTTSYSNPAGISDFSYSAEPGERVDARIEAEGTRLVLVERSADISAAPPDCDASSSTAGDRVECPLAERVSVDVEGGELDDRVEIALPLDSYTESYETYSFIPRSRTTADLGRGNDVLRTVSSSATLTGGEGNDELSGGSGDGGPGDDVLSGGDASDELTGGAGRDSLAGGDGGDKLSGGPGPDAISGGRGSDTLRYASFYTFDPENLRRPNPHPPVTIDVTRPGGDGVAGENDNVAPDVERFYGTNGNDVIVAGPHNSYIESGFGDDVLIGGAGDDQLDGGPEDDFLAGGAGDDSIDEGHDGKVREGPLVRPRGNDTAHGGPGDDTVLARSGHDRVTGGPGNDVLSTFDFRSQNLSHVIALGRDEAVLCGRGPDDEVFADYYDDVSPSCERVTDGTLRFRTVRSRGKTVRFSLRCLTPGDLPCRGRAALWSLRRDPRKVRPRHEWAPLWVARGRLLGRARFKVRAGRVGSFDLRLARRARRLLRRRGLIRARLTINARGRGGRGRAASRTLTLRPRRHQ